MIPSFAISLCRLKCGFNYFGVIVGLLSNRAKICIAIALAGRAHSATVANTTSGTRRRSAVRVVTSSCPLPSCFTCLSYKPSERQRHGTSAKPTVQCPTRLHPLPIECKQQRSRVKCSTNRAAPGVADALARGSRLVLAEPRSPVSSVIGQTRRLENESDLERQGGRRERRHSRS